MKLNLIEFIYERQNISDEDKGDRLPGTRMKFGILPDHIAKDWESFTISFYQFKSKTTFLLTTQTELTVENNFISVYIKQNIYGILNNILYPEICLIQGVHRYRTQIVLDFLLTFLDSHNVSLEMGERRLRMPEV